MDRFQLEDAKVEKVSEKFFGLYYEKIILIQKEFFNRYYTFFTSIQSFRMWVMTYRSSFMKFFHLVWIFIVMGYKPP